MGMICDRRAVNNLDSKSFEEAEKLLNELNQIYDYNFVELFAKSQEVAQKMISGGELTPEEEESLLMKLGERARAKLSSACNALKEFWSASR